MNQDELKQKLQNELDQKLIDACLEGKIEIGEEAIAEGANVNVRNEYGFPILNFAAWHGHTGVVKMLLKSPHINVNGTDTNDNNSKPLTLAVNKANTEIVEELLKHPDIDVNVKDNAGLTAIQLATWFGFPDIVSKLLKHPNININVVDNEGKSPMDYAKRRGHIEIIQLIEKHVNPPQ